jgi:hypothetical protein
MEPEEEANPHTPQHGGQAKGRDDVIMGATAGAFELGATYRSLHPPILLLVSLHPLPTRETREAIIRARGYFPLEISFPSPGP